MEKLIEHITKINDEKTSWMEETGGWTGLYSVDTEYWSSLDVKSIEDFELMEMAQSYSDVYKDVYGSRPRGEMPKGEALKKEMNFLYNQLDKIIEEDKQREEDAIVDFQVHIENMMSDFCIDMETAIRWDMEANDTNDVDHYKWNHNLPYDYDLGMKE